MKKCISKIITLTAGVLLVLGFSGCNLNINMVHEHTFSSAWTSDDDSHWHAPLCEHLEETSGKEAHTWDDGKVTKEATEEAEGEKTYKCKVCERTKTETIAKLSHKHAYKEEWASDATQHWHDCPGCKEKGSLANHEWEGDKCKICGYENQIKDETAEDKKTEDDKKKDEDVKKDETPAKYKDDLNPLINKSASTSLDYIFNTASVGTTTITIKRSEWNQLLKNFDYFYKNENNVAAESYEYEKDGISWKLNNVGLRLRGNTSRFRPQGKDSPTDLTGHKQPNESWSKDYYTYAANCSDNDYRQSHFKIDFEPLDDDDRKLSSCMKGVALKRMDGSCTKEIFCYDLFHRYGIWTAPRASHTRVIIKFIEDDGSITEINYGVYEMFEEVSKDSRKARDKDENKASNAWKNGKGTLWKCSGGDLTNPNATMYPEKVKITEFDTDGTPKNYVWDSPTYDLKTNKTEPEASKAVTEFRSFITELNALPSTTDAESIAAIKNFYDKWMDVDFFLKTYAVNILVGMDDDYWSNANNYYLYFTDVLNSVTQKTERKVYFIPFDYDNTIGASIKGDKSKGEKEGIEQNPLEWGRGANRPLMDKLLMVPEYKQLFINKLKEVSAPDSEWNFEKCSQRWQQYWTMVDQYLDSPNLSSHVCTKGHWDNTYKPSKSLVNQGNNIYDYTRECFYSYILDVSVDLNGGTLSGQTGQITLSGGMLSTQPERTGYMFLGWTKTKDGSDFVTDLSGSETYYARWHDISSYNGQPAIFEIKNDNITGICIGIYGMPADTVHRNIYIKDKDGSSDYKLVAQTQNYQTSTVNKNMWVYPYTVSGKSYKIRLCWTNSSWGWIKDVYTTITATSGVGENYTVFKAADLNTLIPYEMNNNVVTWKDAPKIFVAGKEISSSNKPGKLLLELRGGKDTTWSWYGSYEISYPIKDFNLVTDWQKYLSNNSWNTNTLELLKTKDDLYLNVLYEIKDSSYGDYRVEALYDFHGDRCNFSLQ